jgi:hypothetical protein
MQSILYIIIDCLCMNVSGMKNDYDNNQDILNDLSDTINDLNRRILIAQKNIISRSEYYRTCVS